MAGIQLVQAGGAGSLNAGGAQNPTPFTGALTGLSCVLAVTGTAPTTYAWALAVPPGSTATLSTTTGASPTFTPDKPGNYAVVLTDNTGAVYTLQLAPVSQVAGTVYTGPQSPAYLPPSNVATPPVGESLFCDPTNGGALSAKLPDTSVITFVATAMPAMKQLNWFIDPVNGSDGNSGATAGASLKTDAERQRRMGPSPTWNAGEYHIRYLNDVPATDPVRVVGTRARNSTIFLHGSVTDGQGQSILFNGSITALTVLDNSTAGATHAWHLTAGALPVSWTASNLVNRRIRMTSGASLGAKSFAIKDLGTKQARCDEFLIRNTYTFPFNFQLNTKAPPSNADTFVVERLTSIVSFFWHVEDVDDGGLNTAFMQGCVESLAMGVDSAGNVVGDFNVIVGGDDVLCFDGCMCVWFGAGYGGTIFFGSTGIYGQMQPGAWQNAAVSGGHYSGATPPNIGLSATALFIELQNNFIFQLSAGILRVQCFCQFFDVAIFDSTSTMRIHGARVEFRGKLWGTGNTGRIAEFDPAARALFDANAAFPISVATSPEFGFIFAGGTRTSIPAFDVTTNTYTADRTATLAHLTASIAGGGFNNSMVDPVSGGALVKQ